MKTITAVCIIIFCIPVLCIGEELEFTEDDKFVFTEDHEFENGDKIMAGVFNKIFNAIEEKMLEISVLKERLEDVEKKIPALTKSLEEVKKNMISEGAVLEILPIGTIIPSMVEPAKINSKMKKYFIPCDGREIPGDSAYFSMVSQMDKSHEHMRYVPDLRGQFIRGLNYFDDFKGSRDDGKQDPAEEVRTPGDYQPDAIIGHRHLISSYTSGATVRGNDLPVGGGRQTENEHKWYPTIPPDAVDKDNKDISKSETRPKNIAVYYYVKIN